MYSQKSKISRRDFLKKTGIGLGAITLGTAVSSRVFSQNPGITVAIQSFAHKPLQPILNDFTDKTGIQVSLESMPSSGTDALTKLTTYYSTGTSPYDVVNDSDESCPTFMRAGWLEPLDDIFPEDFWDDFPPGMMAHIREWGSYKGNVYRIPHGHEFGFFWYRKDWFDKRGLKVPETWEEMIEVGKAFKEEGIWGVEDALTKPALLYVYLAFLSIQSGGDIFSFDYGTQTCFKFVHDMIYEHKIFPKAALNKNYDQINQDYMQDRIAMMRQWPYFWSVTRGNTEWYEEGKAAIALPPKGPCNRKSWAGGWGWTIPKFAKNKEAAKEFMRFITSKDTAIKLAKADSWFLNTRKSVMNVVGDEGLAKYMNMYSDANATAPRPKPPVAQVAKAQSVVDDVASSYLINQIDLNEAMRRGKEQMEQLKKA